MKRLFFQKSSLDDSLPKKLIQLLSNDNHGSRIKISQKHRYKLEVGEAKLTCGGNRIIRIEMFI